MSSKHLSTLVFPVWDCVGVPQATLVQDCVGVPQASLVRDCTGVPQASLVWDCTGVPHAQLFTLVLKSCTKVLF